MSQTYTDDVFTTSGVVQTEMANIEDNFAALKSAFSGATAPSNPVAGMWWFDTTANILKLRNEANNAWQSVWDFASNKPVITNLSNEITGAMIAASAKDPVAATAGLRTLGTGALQAAPGNYVPPTHTGDVTGATALTIGVAKVSQSKLKTSTGSVNTGSTTFVILTLPGGQYGFYPQTKNTDSSSPHSQTGAKICDEGGNVNMSSYATRIALLDSSGSFDSYAQQRYITASGEVHWIFILRNKVTKDIISTYQAPDHPCFGNGGKPLLTPHPFGNYDESKHEIIVVNPTNEEIEQMELETIVEDETKPDKDLLEVIAENYEIDEDSSPAWPTKEVTVGLPKHVVDKKTGKKVLADYRFMSPDTIVEPVKKVIPKPSYIKTKRLKRKK